MTLTRKQRLLLLAIETIALAALVGWILLQLDRVTEPSALLVGFLIVAAGDVATALVMQRFAPTPITLEPGEGVELLGRALSDFDAAAPGRILLRGERWRARAKDGSRVRTDEPVRVVGRDGLTLIVEPAPQSE